MFLTSCGWSVESRRHGAFRTSNNPRCSLLVFWGRNTACYVLIIYFVRLNAKKAVEARLEEDRPLVSFAELNELFPSVLSQANYIVPQSLAIFQFQ